MDENQNENMTAPPSPEVDNNSTPDADMEAWIQKTIGDYNKTQERPKLASQLKSQPDEFSYGKWNEDEENIIKNEIAPELIRDMTDDDDTVTKNFQKILNDPYETLYSGSDLGNKVKDKLIDKVLNKSWEKTERVPDFMNKLQHMRKLYYTAVNSKDEGYRKSAVKQINTYRKALGQFMDGLDDKSMQELKNAMLLTEYGQAYQDITSKNVPNSTEIYIIPRETSIPIITTQPVKGAYRTTVGDFKTDLYKLATNRDSDAINLPSGFTMTRGNDKRTSLKDTDLREMLNPEFYRELTEEQRERLGKEGLELFFKPHNADIVAALDRLGLKLGNEDILDSIDASTKAVIEAILASQADSKTKQKKILEELEKAKKEAKAARGAQAKAEQGKKEAEDRVAGLEEEKWTEQQKKETKEQARDAVIMNPSVKIKRQDAGKQAGEIRRVVSDLMRLPAEQLEELGGRQFLSKLERYAENLENLHLYGGTADGNIVADALRDLSRAANNPIFRGIYKTFKAVPYVGDMIDLWNAGKYFYDQWRNAENAYKAYHDPVAFKEYTDKMTADYPKAMAYYMEEMGDKQDLMALWTVQLRDQVPTLRKQTNDFYSLPNRKDAQTVLSGLRPAEMDLVHSAAQGYDNRTGKDKNNINKYKVDQGQIRNMLGIDFNATNKEVKLLEQNPWLLSFMRSMSDTIPAEDRFKALKKIRNQYEDMFKAYQY